MKRVFVFRDRPRFLLHSGSHVRAIRGCGWRFILIGTWPGVHFHLAICLLIISIPTLIFVASYVYSVYRFIVCSRPSVGGDEQKKERKKETEGERERKTRED